MLLLKFVVLLFFVHVDCLDYFEYVETTNKKASTKQPLGSSSDSSQVNQQNSTASGSSSEGERASSPSSYETVRVDELKKCSYELQIIESLVNNNRDLALALRDAVPTTRRTPTTTETTTTSTPNTQLEESTVDLFSISDEDFEDGWFDGNIREEDTSTTTQRAERDYPDPAGPVRLNIYFFMWSCRNLVTNT